MQRILKMLGAAALVPAMFFAVNTVNPQDADAQWGRGHSHRHHHHRGHYHHRGFRHHHHHHGYRNYHRGWHGHHHYGRHWRGPRYGVSTPYGSFYWR